jgi:hypothetical protein
MIVMTVAAMRRKKGPGISCSQAPGSNFLLEGFEPVAYAICPRLLLEEALMLRHITARSWFDDGPQGSDASGVEAL